MSEGPGRGTRDNGLRCGNYVAIADLDPRIADALLSTLRDEGIAAYAAPTPGATGGYGERRLPSRPVDRLWVDDQHLPRAREIVRSETEEAPTAAYAPGVDHDLDTAWQQVLASLQSPSDTAVPPWPVSEDVDSAAEPAGGALETHVIRPATVEAPESESSYEEDEHFVPPPPPPLPRLQTPTLLSLLTIVFGLLILASQWDGGTFDFLGVICVVAGVANLIYHMRQGPPTDSGWDDGAVV